MTEFYSSIREFYSDLLTLDDEDEVTYNFTVAFHLLNGGERSLMWILKNGRAHGLEMGYKHVSGSVIRRYQITAKGTVGDVTPFARWLLTHGGM